MLAEVFLPKVIISLVSSLLNLLKIVKAIDDVLQDLRLFDLSSEEGAILVHVFGDASDHLKHLLDEEEV